MVEFSMEQYLVQMETRLQASQTALETRLETAQASLKRDLQASQTALETRLATAQASLKIDLQAAQVKSEERMHMHNQALSSALTYKVLFLGCGVAFAGFVFLEGLVKGLGYEVFVKKID